MDALKLGTGKGTLRVPDYALRAYEDQRRDRATGAAVGALADLVRDFEGHHRPLTGCAQDRAQLVGGAR